MSDERNTIAFIQLVEAGCCPVRLDMHVEGSIDGSFRLGRQFGGALVELIQILHLLAGQETAGIGPALLSGGRAYANESSANLQYVEFVAMFRGRDRLRSGRNFLAQV